MRIAVVGLGHLGSVTATCMAKIGHEVIGIDRDQRRVDAFQRGKSPVDEPALPAMIRDAWRNGRLSAVNQISRSILDRTLLLVCVDTPAAKRSLAMKSVVEVCERLLEVGHSSVRLPVVVIRSTLPPGAYDETLAGFASPRGKLRLAYNPDFSREGNAVADFMNPGRIVIGVRDRHVALKVRQLYKSIKAPVHVTEWNNVEILKCAENSFHALKVCFANEIASLSEAFGADGQTVMSLLCADTRLNIAPAYLRPGLPFGGPCLEKDLNALLGSALRQNIKAPLLAAIPQSNRQHFERIVQAIKKKHARVGFLGLSHKSGVNDYRGSHLLALAERLQAAGVTVKTAEPKLERGARIAIVRDSDIVFAPGRMGSVGD